MTAKLTKITKDSPMCFFAIIVVFETFVMGAWQRGNP